MSSFFSARSLLGGPNSVFSTQQRLSAAGFMPLPGSADLLATFAKELNVLPADSLEMIGVVSRDEFDSITGVLVGMVSEDEKRLDVKVLTPSTTRRSGLNALLDLAECLDFPEVTFTLEKNQSTMLKPLMFLGFTPAKMSTPSSNIVLSYDLASAACA